MSEQKDHLTNLISTLKQQRDELALKIHLGTMESKEELEKLTTKLDQLNRDLEPTKSAVEESAGDILESMKRVAEEVKNGFENIRKTL